LRKLNINRMLERIETLGRIGATPEGGVRRIAATLEDKAGRDQIVAWMRELNLKVEIDRIGNIFGTLEGINQLPPLMMGSHIDTVSNGGKLDGPLGVIAGLEIISSFRDASLIPARPITIAVFTNEEGVRFQPDMMGSLVHAGGMEVEQARAAKDRNRMSLGQALDDIGYSGDLSCGAVTPSWFLEIHIEQGPVLEAENITLGAIEGVQGIYWTGITIKGQANHAGTTPMSLRKDAGYIAARLAVEARKIASEIDGQVATVGRVDLKPNLINVVAGEAYLTVDLRNANETSLRVAQQRLEDVIAAIAHEEGAEIDTEALVRFAPVEFDPAMVDIIEQEARRGGFSIKRMVSGAGHDAQMMARICPTAMIFIPSIAGVSHNPNERTHAADIEAGLAVLSRTVDRLLQS
jgi:N-carbamoyl-L-amino-acid hydrolase